MTSIEEKVVKKLKSTQRILSTVESCTGGLIAHWITNVSGASSIYWGSTIAYDNTLKEKLGVPRELIAQQGAVSAEVAQALAEAKLQTMQTTLAQSSSYSLIQPQGFVSLATTGIAGPTGGTLAKPLGLCFLGLALSEQKTQTLEIRVAPSLSRLEIKNAFAYHALEFLLQTLENLKK